MTFNEKKFAVLGMGLSGISVAKILSKHGAYVFLSDNKSFDKVPDAENIKSEFDCEFDGHSDKILESDYIVVSPGIPLNIPILQKAKELNIKITSEIEVGFALKHKNSKIIAVTGSNGKSTVVSLIHHILTNMGFETILCGNIGIPFTSCPIEDEKVDFIVIELSSFQLELVDKFKADKAILLNITPDHLNRYGTMDVYAKAKMNIFKNHTQTETAVLNFDDKLVSQLTNNLPSYKLYFSLNKKTDAYFKDNFLVISFEETNFKISVNDLSLLGPHNIYNALASLLSVADYIQDIKPVIQALKTFKSLSHRLEQVGIINGVIFINDSKATNTDSVKFALQTFNKPVHIILGGSDKGEDYSILKPFLKNAAKSISLIGSSKDNMLKTFTDLKITMNSFGDFSSAIKSAFDNASDGEYVLLSPSCASYDMFKNFEHRGDTFRQIVKGLANEYKK